MEFTAKIPVPADWLNFEFFLAHFTNLIKFPSDEERHGEEDEAFALARSI
jgi:hypothetical protein